MIAARRGVAAVCLPVRPAELSHPGVRPVLLLVQAGFAVHLLVRGSPEPPQEHHGAQLWVERSTPEIAARLLRLRPELLMVESSTFGVLFGDLARRSWIRNPRWAAAREHRKLQRLSVRRFDAVTFTNPAERRPWRLRPGTEAELPYPVDVEWWGERVERRPEWWSDRGWTLPDGPVIACNAAYEGHKRHRELIDWLAPWLRERPHARLVLFGHRWNDPAVFEMVKSRPAELGIGGQVLATDWISAADIRQLLAWCDLTVINSTRETQCLAVYEALAAGVPTLISAIPELVSQFPALPAHRDGTELRANATRLLEEPDHAAAVLRASRARVESADLRRHDALFAAAVGRLLGRELGTGLTARPAGRR